MADRHRKPRPARDHPTRTRARTGPFCDATRHHERDDTTGEKKHCRLPAGYRTDHPGQGRCRFHGGASPIRHGRYATVLHTSVREALDQLAKAETDVMDLIPEAQLLRALTADYINRYEDFSAALMAWYADADKATKPRRVLDIADAGHLVEAITRVIHRLHTIQSEGAITLETFKRVTEQMGIVVARHVKDEAILAAIEADWNAIALDAKAPAHRAPDPDLELKAEDLVDDDPAHDIDEDDDAGEEDR